VPSLEQGQIVWVRIADQTGRNPKCRPAVIVTRTNEITPHGQIVVVAATGVFRRPLPENTISLPWAHGGHQTTGLKKECVAICDWLVTVNVDDIDSVGGRLPPSTLRSIIENLPRQL